MLPIPLVLLSWYARAAPTQRGGYRLARLARGMLSSTRWRGRFSTPVGELGLDLGTYPDVCMVCGLYELDTARLIRRLLSPGSHFVDCGANLGYFSLLAARIVGSSGRVDAFEPDPLNRARLLENRQSNGAQGCLHVHEQAVGESPARQMLFHPMEEGGMNHGEASLFHAEESGQWERFEVEVDRLENLVEGQPDLIKMDIEGGELAAVKGLGRMAQSQRPPALIIEHNPPACARAGHKPGDLLRALRGLNGAYRAYWVGWRLTPLADAEQIDSMGREGNILYRVD